MSMCLQGMVDQLMQKRETGSAKWIERRNGAVKKNLNAGFYMRRDGSTLFESPLAQSIDSSPSSLSSPSLRGDDAAALRDGALENGVTDGDADTTGETGVVSLSRTLVDESVPREPNLADRVQRVVAGRVGRSANGNAGRFAGIIGKSASDNRLNGAGSSGSSVSSSASIPNYTASNANARKLSNSRTMPNGFSMAYRPTERLTDRPVTVSENTAFDGIREDDL